ncbi:MFS general substrate transporter [Ramicandelaber brevisporus]|nr:MFS general substrate transporter [Ramicandelaber brevisporus]
MSELPSRRQHRSGGWVSGIIDRLKRWRRAPLAVAITAGLAIFIDMLIYGIIVPVAPDLLKKVGKDTTMANGVLFGCFGIGILVMSPIFGYVSDRYNTRKWPMIVGLIGLIVGTIFFAIAEHYWELIVARIAQGAASGITWSISLSMVSDAYPKEMHGQVMGSVFGCNVIGFLIGPTIGGILYKYGGHLAPFIFSAVLTGIDLLARLYLQSTAAIESTTAEVSKSSPNDTISPSSGNAEPREKATMLKLITSPQILICLLATLIVGGTYSSIDPTLPIHLRNIFNMSSDQIGYMFIAMVLPNAITSPIIGKYTDNNYERVPRMLVTGLGFLVMAPMLVLLAVPRTVWLEVIFLVIVGTFAAIAVVPIMPELGARMEKLGGGAAGQLFSIFNAAWATGMIAGPIVSGILVDAVGFLNAMFVLGGILLVACPIVWYTPIKQVLAARRRDRMAVQTEDSVETA